MKGLLFNDIEDIRYDSTPDPKLLAPTDVIVKVSLTAICGSDLHIYYGREQGLDTGTVMGHEFVGEVVEVGRDVRKFRPGDQIFSPFFSSCGGCYYCDINLSCRCNKGALFGWVESGDGLQGAQAEYVRVPHADTTLHRQPEGIDAEGSLFLCDILPTGYFCADIATGTLLAQGYPHSSLADARILVIGCGPVGLMGILGLKHKKFEHILAVDLVEERLNLATELGATTINGSTGDALEQVLHLTDGRGVDIVCEYVGNLGAQELAYKAVRPGGVIAVAGVHNSDEFAFQPVDLYNKNLTYLTGRCPVQRYTFQLIPLVRAEREFLNRVISHRMPLQEGPNGYDIFARKLEGCTKIILTT